MYNLADATKASEVIASITWRPTSNEAVCRANRPGIAELERLHELGDVQASYWLGVAKLNNTGGTGQDLLGAADCFVTAHENRDRTKPSDALKGVVLVQGMMAERANACIGKAAFTNQARTLNQQSNELMAWIAKTVDGERKPMANGNGQQSFAPPVTLLMP